MEKYLRNLSYTFRHKWYVMLACFQVGLYWRGLVHDWSKFLPDEWFAYAEHFFGRPSVEKHEPGSDLAFDAAWSRHWHRHDHHWEWWVRDTTDGLEWAPFPHPMSPESRLEMVCDWYGAGRAQKGSGHEGWTSVRAWWRKHRREIVLHADTSRWVDAFLEDRIP